MGFWERTWEERGDEIRRRFGETDPPGLVISFSWKDLRLPGACALVFPPVSDASNPKGPWHRRPDWLYLTLGLTQPLDKKQVQRERQAGKEYSSHGFELGFLTAAKNNWPIKALYVLVTALTEGLDLKWGDRVALGLYEDAQGVGVYSGKLSALGLDAAQVRSVGNMRAVVIWPYLFPDVNFVTSTGKGMIFIATGITEDEWALAKATTTAQVLLLLFRAGVGQRTDPHRASVLDDPRLNEEWKVIESMGGEAADNALGREIAS